MLDKLIELSLKYKLLVLVAFIAIAVSGYRAYTQIPIDAFPDITPKQVVIYTESPGNSAEDIEKLITYPIESAVSGMAGVKLIMSNSIFGLSYVSVFFEDDMDIYFLRQLVAERLSNVDIPKGWGKPVLGPNTTGLGQVFWYEVKDTTGKYSLQKLKEMQEYIVKPLFKSVSGVEEVIGWGGDEKQYNVLIDTKKLQDFGITYDDIVKALQKSNQAAGGQYLEFNREQYLIRGAGLYKTLDDIRNTVVKPTQGQAITIGDVASVTPGVAPRFGAVSIDNKEAVMGMVLQRTATNAAKVVERIKEKIATVNTALPEGVKISTIYDRTEITHKAVNTMTSALLSGVILVAIVLFLFLFELRSAFIVIISLPLSLLIAFLLMDYYNLSANLMSLSGLAIAVGMIVDGTIVIVENSFRLLHDEPEKDKLTVVSEAAKGVAKPVTFAVLIIAAVFIPLLSLDGLAGKLYTPMALNIVFVMLGSLLVALVLVPVLILMLLKPTKSAENIVMKSIKKFYTPALIFALDNAKKILAVVSVVFIVLAYILTQQGREFLPTLNEESIMYRVIAIPGTALSQSLDVSKEVESYILKKYPDDVSSVLAMIGRSEKGETAQPNYMEILLTLKPNIKDLPLLTKEMSEDLEHKFPFVQFVPTQPIAMRIEELLEGVKAELAIKIYGNDQKVLDKISKDIQSAIKHVDGLERMEVETQLGQAQIQIIPNYLSLARYGISVAEVMQIIRNGIGEEGITQKLEGIKRFPIVAKVQGAKKDIDSIKNVTLRSKNGNIVRLKDVCDIKIVQGASFIKRENLSRYMVVSMDVEGRDMASFVAEADKIIKEKVKMPAGYYIGWAGDFKNMQEATQKLMIIIPITIFLVILLLYTAFNSLTKSMIILLNVPFGFIGGIIALLIGGIYLSVSAIVGFLAIFAIAILNGIVLVSFIDELRAKYPDVDLKILLKDATLLRLRPVLMTAFTTLFGILPLLYATGVGSEIQYPLAVVITGGIISSTLLTLLILPSTYLLFYEKEKS
ncbi:efflux RND transporter permease subunit [Sulfurimonas autotrophica]|uniref:Heavy metal efflux pump, CzcA family n=1 Tax=Sulfurimonas autotrophica (strain ATCC BAA-671 / DSM 16294 / JCM 11897 / OK10) TaxID=563040 RepID=E0UP51_SULAO|nr:CusA/CzcA family heavy metal efflux RND transporter [Sulfurimonas autotrophica]ADN08084.1 heavy metal efflux pump, CzcA family [Sulfurimonas autotrophica DSM 16294]